MPETHFHILVYYFGTTTLSGSKRWREMAGLLLHYGKVTVYCADGEGEACPEGVEVIRIPDGIRGQSGNIFAARSQAHPFLAWARKLGASLLCWPDAQKRWSREIVSTMGQNLDLNVNNIVITSGPIFSIHSEMCKWVTRNPKTVRWVMDFRDLWTNEIAPGLERRMPNCLTKLERPIEQRCHDTADLVTAIGQGLAKLLREDFGSDPLVLYNGYLASEVKQSQAERKVTGPKKVRYLGTIFPGLRSPALLFEAAAKLQLTDQQILFEFWCNDQDQIWKDAQRFDVQGLVKCHEGVGQQDALELIKSADANVVLNGLTPNANQVVTGKVFELMAVQRPVIAISGKDSELRKILATCGTTECVWDLDTACKILESLIEGSLPKFEDTQGQFSRESAVSHLLERLKIPEEG